MRNFILLMVLLSFAPASAENGYRLWLRYNTISDASQLTQYRQALSQIVIQGNSPTIVAARKELKRGLDSLLGQTTDTVTAVSKSGAIVGGTTVGSSLIGSLSLDLSSLKPDGYLIRSVQVSGQPSTVIASSTDLGVLYGAFHLLRLVQTRRPFAGIDIRQSPHIKLRVLNHWDNPDGSIERGYAGNSLWKWSALPGTLDPRYTDYARACASIGINGAVLNNVNANSCMLTSSYIAKVAALANVFRPYGIKVYLVPLWSAPIDNGKLATADPLDAGVIAYWKNTVDAIYALIPDFGGFLVKAGSEGQPGPGQYGRTHAQGANCLADALAPHNGVVMWRAFVYSPDMTDRANAAYAEFKPLDGQFHSNVFVQSKNGPLDFQPREPAAPLFGSMPKTPLSLELEITEEYLGQSTHGIYLAPMWKEVLDWDTYANGLGNTVGKVIDGTTHGSSLSCIAGVANTGSDSSWCGHHLLQANWYAFGRLAWDYSLTSDEIAREWTRMTWTNDSATVETITGILMGSYAACVNYQEPLGLLYLCDPNDHYAPKPSANNQSRADWNATYYHRADSIGVGFDRTSTGSNNVSQYRSPLLDQFASIDLCPEKLLCYFHHVSWTRTMKSGRTFWDELNAKYNEGVSWVTSTIVTWNSLSGKIDTVRFNSVRNKLTATETHAKLWRDTCLSYFKTFYDKRQITQIETAKEVRYTQSGAVQWKLYDLRGRCIAMRLSDERSLNKKNSVSKDVYFVMPVGRAADDRKIIRRLLIE